MARKLIVEIVGDASSLEKAFDKSSRSARKFNRDIDKAGRGAAAGSGAFKSFGRSVAFASGSFLGAAGFTAAVKSSIDAAADFAEEMSKTDAVFESSAQQVEEWSKTTTEAFGISQRQALETASSFGALFAPIGIVGDQAAKQSEKLTELGADLASFYNTDVQSALDAIRSGLVGESEPLRRYGVRLSETRVQQVAMADSGKKNAKALTEQEKSLARLKIIFQDTAKAQGDFAKSSDRLPAQIKKAQANIDNLSVSIGLHLVPALTKGVDWLGKFGHAASSAGKGLDTKRPFGLLGDWLGINPKQRLPGKTPPGLRGPTGPLAPGMRGLLEPGAGGTGPTKQQVERVKRSAAQLNEWFDAMIGRRLDRVQDIKTLDGQIRALGRIRALVEARLKITKDVTRRMALEDQILEINRQIADDRAQKHEAILAKEEQIRQLQEQQREKAAAQREQMIEARRAAEQNVLDWLSFGIERAQATKGVGDDIKALRKMVAKLKELIRLHGRSLELVRQLWQTEQELKRIQDERKKTRRSGGGGFRGGGIAGFSGSAQSLEFGPGGHLVRAGAGVPSVPTVRPPAAPSSGFGAGTTYHINTLVVHADNPAQLEQQLQRRAQQRPQTRRGPV